MVCVIVTTRNRRALLREALASIDALERPNFAVEVVVVDNGSSDGTADDLARSGHRIVHVADRGIAEARNAGLAASTGDIVQFLDDDDILLPRSIVDRLDLLDANPHFGSVHGTAIMTDKALNPISPPVPGGPQSSGWVLEDLLRYFPQIGTVLTRRSVFETVGSFDERYAGDDEWDFLLRAARQYQVGRIETPVMLFRQRADAAEEEQQWERSAGNHRIVRENTAHLPAIRRWRIRLGFWRLRGWHASVFVHYAALNLRNRAYRRTLRSLAYAIRWSPAHALVCVIREARRRETSRQAGSSNAAMR